MKVPLSVVVLVSIVELTSGAVNNDPKCRQPCPMNYEPFDAKDSKGTTRTFSNECVMRVHNNCHGTDFKKTCLYTCGDDANDAVTAQDSEGNSHDFPSCCHMHVSNLCDRTHYSSDKCSTVSNEAPIRVITDGKISNE